MALYEVTYTPLAVIERECAKRGMKDGDGTSFWDWVNDGNFIHAAARYGDLRSAAIHAKGLVPLDVCGETRVEQIVRVQPIGAPPYWATVAVWHIYDDVDPEGLTESEPDERREPEWADEDTVRA